MHAQPYCVDALLLAADASARPQLRVVYAYGNAARRLTRWTVRDKICFAERILELEVAAALARGEDPPRYKPAQFALRLVAYGFEAEDADAAAAEASAPLAAGTTATRYATVVMRLHGTVINIALAALALPEPPPAVTLVNLTRPHWNRVRQVLFHVLDDDDVNTVLESVMRQLCASLAPLAVEAVDAMLSDSLMEALVHPFAAAMSELEVVPPAVRYVTSGARLTVQSHRELLRVVSAVEGDHARLEVVSCTPGAALNAALAALGLPQTAEEEAAGGGAEEADENVVDETHLRRSARRAGAAPRYDASPSPPPAAKPSAAKRSRSAREALIDCSPRQPGADEPEAGDTDEAAAAEAAAASRMAAYLVDADAMLARHARRVACLHLVGSMRADIAARIIAIRSIGAALLARAARSAMLPRVCVAVNAASFPGVPPGAMPSAAFLAFDGGRVQLIAGAAGLAAGAVVALTAEEATALGLLDQPWGAFAHERHFGIAFSVAAATPPHCVAQLVPPSASGRDADVAWAPLQVGDGVDTATEEHAIEVVPALRTRGTLLRLRACVDMPTKECFALAHAAQAVALLCHPTAADERPPRGGFSVALADDAAAGLGASCVVHLRLLRAVAEGEELRCDAAACAALVARLATCTQR